MHRVPRHGITRLSRRSFLWGAGAALAAAGSVRAVADGGASPSEPSPVLEDDFDQGSLAEDWWVRTAFNDFETEVVDVTGGRLRLACSTIGTDDSTVKYHGVRTAEPVVSTAHTAVVECTLDWNSPPNGCYMQAGLYLSPEASDCPVTLDDRLEFVYIGVPPGQTARGWLTLRQDGLQPRVLYDEGWPQDRTGRSIGVQRLTLEISPTRLVLWENGEVLLEAHDSALGWEQAYLYLQQSSHSNYPLRTVFFDEVRVLRLT